MMSAIVLIIVTVILMITGFAIGISTDNINYIFCIFLGFLFLPAVCDLTCGPKDKDVIEGRAVYVETTHILNGDTTYTYELKWKKQDDVSQNK